MAYEYELLKVEVSGRVATITVDNPPINIITLPLYAELRSLSEELEQDSNPSQRFLIALRLLDPDPARKRHHEKHPWHDSTTTT